PTPCRSGSRDGPIPAGRSSSLSRALLYLTGSDGCLGPQELRPPDGRPGVACEPDDDRVGAPSPQQKIAVLSLTDHVRCRNIPHSASHAGPRPFPSDRRNFNILGRLRLARRVGELCHQVVNLETIAFVDCDLNLVEQAVDQPPPRVAPLFRA